MIPPTDPAPRWVDQGRHRLQARIWHGVAVIILLMVHLAWGLMGHHFAVEADGAEYVQMAYNLRSLGWLTCDGIAPTVGKPPGMPAVLAAYTGIVGSLTGFHVLQLLSLFAAYLFIAAIVARRLGLKTAIAVLLLLVAVDPLRSPASNTLTEPIFLSLTALGMWAILKSREALPWKYALLAGVAFAASTYIRPVNLYWPLALLLLALIASKARIRAVLCLVGVYTALVAPWVFRNSMIMKRPVPFVANWGPLYAMTDEALWRTFWREGWGGIYREHRYDDLIEHQSPYNPGPAEKLRNLSWGKIETDPGAYLARCAKQSVQVWTYVPGTHMWEWGSPIRFWLGRGMMILFYGVCFLGARSMWRRDRWFVVTILSYVIYTAAIHFPVTTESRYLIGAYLCLLPLAAAGIARVARRLPGGQAFLVDHPDESVTI